MFNVSDLARIAADRWPDREAIVHGTRRHTFGAVATMAAERAAYLDRIGVEPGDMVVTVARNSDVLVVTYLALAALGAVNVPISPIATQDEIAEAVDRTGARTLLHDEAASDRVDALEAEGPTVVRLDLEFDEGMQPRDISSPVGGDDPGMVIFTSGSSNRPKACVKSHANLIWHALSRQLSNPTRPRERELYCIPLSGIGFANFVLPHFLSGTTVVIDQFEPRSALRAIQEEKITYAFMPPTMLHAMLAVPDQESFDTSSLIRIGIAYELPQPMRRRLVERFGQVFEFGYGSTEGTSSYASPEKFLDDPQCVGVVLGLDEIRVVDESGRELPDGETGEIVARGPTVMRAYLGDEGLTARTFRDGWYHTGDLGWFGPGRNLHFDGRIKDMIKSGGMNVAAAEVEGVLAECPGVDQVAVVGLPDDRWGESVVASVVAGAGTELAQEDLVAFARERLAGYKRPKCYVFLPDLPLNAAGKVAKPKLREILAAARGGGRI
jgi:fatty-acyl-CoA synthase